MPPGYGELLPIPVTGDNTGGQRLFGGGQELFLDEGDVEEDYKNPQQGGVGAAGVWIIFFSHGTVSVAIRLGDLGGHPPYGKVPGGVPVTGGDTDDVEATAA